VQDPIVALYVAAVLARRLDGANQALIDLKGQLQAGQPPSMLGKTIERIEGLLGPSANLAYAGYPYDPHS
jgi:CRP/FNR family transcriptional regulator, cyclic AMP receptor protein